VKHGDQCNRIGAAAARHDDAFAAADNSVALDRLL
jgi:hypothetical protein